MKLKNSYIDMEIKRKWNSPVKEVQQFVPQEYCDGCFTYTANLVCDLGQSYKNQELPFGWEGYHRVGWNEVYNFEWEGYRYKGEGAEHGAACAESTVTVTLRNGVLSLSGTEGADKTHVVLESVSIPGVEDVDHVGQKFTGCYWESAGNYKHRGNGEVTYFSRQANAS